MGEKRSGKRRKLKRKRGKQSSLRAKKLKPSSLDPLELLPVHVHDLIYQHLKVADIKALSEVTTSFYQSTGTSKICMRMIRLVVAESTKDFGQDNSDEAKKEPTRKTVSSILNSTRKYTAVKLSTKNRTNLDFIVPFLDAISDSIVELELDHIRSHQSMENVKFRELKSLIIGSSSFPCFLKELFKSIVTIPLQKLNVKCSLTAEVVNHLKEFTCLRELSLEWNQSNVKLLQVIASLSNLKLVKLTIKFLDAKSTDSPGTKRAKIQAAINLLDSQKDTLKHVVLKTDSQALTKKALSLQGLKCIELERFPSSANSVLRVQNDSIVVARFKKPFNLVNLPNLRYLVIDTLDPYDLRMLATTALKLRDVWFINTKEPSFRTVYQSLIRSLPEINSTIAFHKVSKIFKIHLPKLDI